MYKNSNDNQTAFPPHSTVHRHRPLTTTTIKQLKECNNKNTDTTKNVKEQNYHGKPFKNIFVYIIERYDHLLIIVSHEILFSDSLLVLRPSPLSE